MSYVLGALAIFGLIFFCVLLPVIMIVWARHSGRLVVRWAGLVGMIVLAGYGLTPVWLRRRVCIFDQDLCERGDWLAAGSGIGLAVMALLILLVAVLALVAFVTRPR